MPTIQSNGHIQSEMFSRIPGIIHGYTTKEMGDMRQAQHLRQLADSLGTAKRTCVTLHQTHGSRIVFLDTDESSGQPQGDGLMMSRGYAQSAEVFLAVRTADCMPICLADTNGTTIAVVHAGWKGLYNSIIENVVSSFSGAGILPKDIRVSIGPSIGPCCYEVSGSLIRDFEKKFGTHSVVSKHDDNTWRLDLQQTAVSMFRDSGVLASNIDSDALCTSCHTDRFYSYRKDTKASFGEIAGFMGFI